MLVIEQTYLIEASPERVWAALTDPALMAQWTGEPAEYDARVGGAYRLWTEYVNGTVVECDPPNRLQQTWKPSDWTIEDSTVTFILTPVAGGTRLDLLHENVQPEDYEGTSQGWNDSYVGAIKKMLEVSAPKKRAPAHKTAAVKKTTAPKKTAARKKTTAPKKTTARKATTASKKMTKKRR